MVIGQLKGVEQDRIGDIIRIQYVRARRTRRNVAASCTCENTIFIYEIRRGLNMGCKMTAIKN